jgi:hypothetical protein
VAITKIQHRHLKTKHLGTEKHTATHAKNQKEKVAAAAFISTYIIKNVALFILFI